MFHDCPLLSDESIETLLRVSVPIIPISSLTFSLCPKFSNEVCQIISSYAHSFNLKKLHFMSCRNIGDKGVESLVTRSAKFGNLSFSSLTFSKCPSMTEKGFIAIINKFDRSLSSIDFSSDCEEFVGITDKVLLVLADKYSSSSTILKKIDFSGSNHISDVGVQAIASKVCNARKSSSLRELYLSHCPKLTANSIHSFCKIPVLYGMKRNENLRNLMVLYLEGNKNLTMQCLCWIAKACPKLVELNLKECHFMSSKQKIGDQISQWKNSIAAEIESRDSEIAIKHLSSLSYLRVLDLNGCVGLFVNNNIVCTYLSECIAFTGKDGKEENSMSFLGLEYFDLSGVCVLRDTNVDDIVKLNPSLNHFAISSSPYITDQSINSIVTNLKSLKFAAFSNLLSMTDYAIEAISKLCFRYLLELNISRNEQLNSKSMQNLDRMRLLAKLDISYCSQLNDLALKWLPRASLEQLYWLMGYCNCQIQVLNIFANNIQNFV